MKIPAKKVVRRYELTYLLSVSYTETEMQAFREGVEAILTKNGATIESTEDWGKKELAYDIKFKQNMQSEAVYVHVVFVAKPESIKGIELQLKLDADLMRYLLVVADEPFDKPAKAKKSTKATLETQEEASEEGAEESAVSK